MKSFLLTLTTCFLLTLPLSAQSDLMAARRPRPPQPVTFDYDKFKDTTFVRGEQFWITPLGKYSGFFNSVELIAGFAHEGPKILKPVEYFHLTFVVKSDEWRFLERSRRDIIILADGIRMQYSDQDHTGSTSTLGGQVSVREILSFTLDRADFRTIAHAKSVEMQVGSLEMKLYEKQKFMLNQLLDAATAK